MKIKTRELSGVALNWAVAKCEGFKPQASVAIVILGQYSPSTEWAQGGPIIEREKISILHQSDFHAHHFVKGVLESECSSYYRAVQGSEIYEEAYDFTYGGKHKEAYGETPLIATMRCYVASKLGEEVDVPEELL